MRYHCPKCGGDARHLEYAPDWRHILQCVRCGWVWLTHSRYSKPKV